MNKTFLMIELQAAKDEPSAERKADRQGNVIRHLLDAFEELNDEVVELRREADRLRAR